MTVTTARTRKVGKDPLRTYRAPDEEYDAAVAAAAANGESLAAVIRRALAEYVRQSSTPTTEERTA